MCFCLNPACLHAWPALACPGLQGLGEALARYWAAAGARLILSSRSLEKLQARPGRAVLGLLSLWLS